MVWSTVMMLRVTQSRHMRTGKDQTGEYPLCLQAVTHYILVILLRAEGENPVLPGSGPAVTSNKSDDDEDQFDDDHDEQCKYDDDSVISTNTEALKHCIMTSQSYYR